MTGERRNALATVLTVLCAVPVAGVGATAAAAHAASLPQASASARTANRLRALKGTPRARNLHVTVTLGPRDPGRLAAYARAVSTPGSPDDRRYLTPRQFGARFGATASRIAQVSAALRAEGLDPGRVSAGGLSIALTASPVALRHAQVAGDGLSPSAHVARDAVQSVVGLDDDDAAHPLAERAVHRRGRSLTADAAPTATLAAGPQACAAAAGAAPAQSGYTDNEIAGAYGFDPLYAAGDEGAGTMIAVYELEPDDPADIAAFQRCYATDADVSYIHVDGGAGIGAGSDEAAFDIENLIGFAPRAHLLVYQAPNSNSGLPGSGPYDLYSAIINQDRAQVVSVSWGQCEAQLGARAARAESTLFEQAAVQGQTIVAAAGDNGAEDCDTGGTRSSTALAVDDPAAQPFVTGVGGTTLQSLGPPPVERAWNSRGGASGSTAAAGAGGGGVSSLWRMPLYQRDAPARLHVVHSAARGPVCGHRQGDCREVPDVAADADPATGYEIYWNGEDTEPEPAGWQALGGTSGAAPVWAALFALADASPACDGSAIGYAGPALYRAAAQAYGTDFHDVTIGETEDTESHGADWTAGRGYDLATGLGTPDAGPLVAGLCDNSARLTAPGPQVSADRAAVGLSLSTGRRGPGATYTAGHLPPGVHLDAHTGLLSGRPRKPGRYHVRAEVRIADGSRATARFDWNVGGAPRITLARLQGGRLALTVACGPNVPWLRRLRIHVPTGLYGGGAAGISAPAGTRLRVRGQVVTVSLRTPAARLSVSIPVRAVAARPSALLSVGARSGTDGTSTLTAMISDGRA
jgi:hypothetical protein